MKKVTVVFFVLLIPFLLGAGSSGDELTHDGKLYLYTKILEKKEEEEKNMGESVTDKGDIPLFTKDFTEACSLKVEGQQAEKADFEKSLFMKTSSGKKDIWEEVRTMNLFKGTAGVKKAAAETESEEAHWVLLITGMVFMGGIGYLIYLYLRKRVKKGFSKHDVQ